MSVRFQSSVCTKAIGKSAKVMENFLLPTPNEERVTSCKDGLNSSNYWRDSPLSEPHEVSVKCCVDRRDFPLPDVSKNSLSVFTGLPSFDTNYQLVTSDSTSDEVLDEAKSPEELRDFTQNLLFDSPDT